MLRNRNVEPAVLAELKRLRAGGTSRELERLRREDARYAREHPGWTWWSKHWVIVLAVVVALGSLWYAVTALVQSGY